MFTAVAIAGVKDRSFALFFSSFMAIFFLSGLGNGSTYRMIPSIFHELGRRQLANEGGDPVGTTLAFKRQAAAVIGIAGAVGAFGGFLIQVVFRQSSLHVAALIKGAKTPAAKLLIARTHSGWSITALWVFLVGYGALAGITWVVYIKRSPATEGSPSLAAASV